MIICTGEILADIYEENGKRTVKAGGAPFNLACGIKARGGKVGFNGAVGDDEIGKFLKSVALEKHFDCLNIKTVNGERTTVARVTLKKGERDFSFERGADEKAEFCKCDCSIAHFGSFFREEKTLAFMNIVRGSALISFDVNYRQVHGAAYSSSVKKYLDICDIIKFSEDELFLIGATAPEDLCPYAKDGKLIIVTLGKRGAAYVYDGRAEVIPTKPIKPKDATGAGDAFLSAVLFEIDKDGKIIPDKLPEIIRKANEAGGKAALSLGGSNS